MNIPEALRIRPSSPTNGNLTTLDSAFVALVKECDRLQRFAHDAAYADPRDPDGPTYRESPEYLANQVNDAAHAIIDYAHELLTLIKGRK